MVGAFLLFFLAGWNANVIAEVALAILDNEVSLGMEATPNGATR